MRNWMSGIRGTVLMIVLWVIGWALGFGGLIEAFIDPNGEIQDVWPTLMAIPGVIGGVAFALVLLIAEGRRSFDEIPLFRLAIWGGFAGIVLGTIAWTKGIEVTLTSAKIFAITTVLGIVAGVGSGIFFRILARLTSAKAIA